MQNSDEIKVEFCFAFLGHPELDSRTTNFYKSLTKRNHSVSLIGFDWLGKGKFNELQNYILFSVQRRPSIHFYTDFIRLLQRQLWKTKAKVYVAEDIYTLPLMVSAAKRNNALVYYDSRELYNYIGGLKNKPLVQRIISAIEKKYIYKVDKIIVTGEMDLNELAGYYNFPREKFIIIRNLPYPVKVSPINIREKFNIEETKKILIYQGIVSKGRGIEKTISAVKDLGNVVFLIFGDGPLINELREIIKQNSLEEKVILAGSVRNIDLLNYTASADIGVALIENISKSYYYALPNKLFEYIYAGIPVIASPLPQMKKIIDKYEIGLTVNPEISNEIKDAINSLINNEKKYQQIKVNTIEASKILNWENEFENVYEKLLYE